MTYKIVFTLQSKDDLFEIYKYVALNDSMENADKLIEQLKLKCLSLDKFPNRGHKLPEFYELGTSTYFEIHYKPYRIIYEIVENTVFINSVLDGRRNMNELLHKRLLR